MKTKILSTLLAVLSLGLVSCSTPPPSQGYLQCKQALVETIAEDIKKGEAE